MLTLGVVLAGIVMLGVFPARTYLTQRRNLAAAEERIEVLSEHNRALAGRAKRLHTDAEIERLAREQYNLVKPGEEAYAILPPPEPERPPRPPQPVRPPDDDRSFWGRLGDTVTFWD